MSKPTIILVPGAWHRGDSYEPLMSALKALGFPVHALTLPSVGSNPTQSSWNPDVETIRSAAVAAADTDADVWLLMHSYGGFPGSEAAQGLDKATREKSGKKGGITKLVYMSAFAVPEGVSLEMAVGGSLPPWIHPHPVRLVAISPHRTLANSCQEQPGNVIATDSHIHFYNDLNEVDQKKHERALLTHSKSTMLTPLSYAAWKYIPSVYIICEKDQAIPLAGQESMVEQEALGGWDVHRLVAGHSPFLSMPDQVAKILNKVFVGSL